MPGRDGTGPVGFGSKTGRGMGMCNTRSFKSGLGFGRGFCRTRFFNTVTEDEEKNILMRQKEVLEDNLNEINKAIGKLKKED